MRYRALSAALPLLVAACATAPKPCPPPVPQLQVQKQVVEVQRPCAATKPIRPAKLTRPLPKDLEQLSALLGAKLQEYEAPGGYADRAEKAIDTCTKP